MSDAPLWTLGWLSVFLVLTTALGFLIQRRKMGSTQAAGEAVQRSANRIAKLVFCGFLVVVGLVFLASQLIPDTDAHRDGRPAQSDRGD